MALFDELLIRIANNETLSAGDIQELRNHARSIDEVKNAVKSWLQPGSADPRFNRINANTGQFVVAPIGTLYLELYGDIPQTIPDDTETAVLFDTTAIPAPTLRWEIGDQTKIFTLVPGKRYAFMGTAQWEANSNGRRGCHINAYNDADVLQWGQTLHSLSPTGTTPDTMPFAMGLVGDAFESSYLKFTVYQNSGGDLDLQYFSVTIFEII